jgi:hypothetical protein
MLQQPRLAVIKLAPPAQHAAARRAPRTVHRARATLDAETPLAPVPSPECAAAKAALRRLLAGTGRGLEASAATRVRIAEAQLSLEAHGTDLDLDTLAGTWRLEYTTAADVLVLLEAERRSFGLLRIGEIYQCFDAYGNIENVIRCSAPPLLAPEGATLRVAARFARAGARTLRLWFDSASLGELRISELLESAIAPALLPRTPPQMMLLQALRAAKLTLPLPGLGRPGEPDADGNPGCATAAGVVWALRCCVAFVGVLTRVACLLACLVAQARRRGGGQLFT